MTEIYFYAIKGPGCTMDAELMSLVRIGDEASKFVSAILHCYLETVVV